MNTIDIKRINDFKEGIVFYITRGGRLAILEKHVERIDGGRISRGRIAKTFYYGFKYIGSQYSQVMFKASTRRESIELALDENEVDRKVYIGSPYDLASFMLNNKINI